jgi:hypothetical protein
MSKADEIKRRHAEMMARSAAAAATPPAADVAPAEAATTAPAQSERRSRVTKSAGESAAESEAAPLATPVRSTVDLAPVRHARLKAWEGETAVEIGVSRVTRQDTLAACAALVLTDETFARRVRAQIRTAKQAQRR